MTTYNRTENAIKNHWHSHVRKRLTYSEGRSSEVVNQSPHQGANLGRSIEYFTPDLNLETPDRTVGEMHSSPEENTLIQRETSRRTFHDRGEQCKETTHRDSQHMIARPQNKLYNTSVAPSGILQPCLSNFQRSHQSWNSPQVNMSSMNDLAKKFPKSNLGGYSNVLTPMTDEAHEMRRASSTLLSHDKGISGIQNTCPLFTLRSRARSFKNLPSIIRKRKRFKQSDYTNPLRQI